MNAIVKKAMSKPGGEAGQKEVAMSAIRRQPQAREDLLDIWSFIADDNARAADALVDRLDDAFAFLAMYPKSGRRRSDIGPGMRSFVVGNSVVFYRIASGAID